LNGKRKIIIFSLFSLLHPGNIEKPPGRLQMDAGSGYVYTLQGGII